MNTEHDKLLKESEVKIKGGKWDITGVEKSKSRRLEENRSNSDFTNQSLQIQYYTNPFEGKSQVIRISLI